MSHGMEHGMEVFLRAMETCVDGGQGNRSCGREYQESESCSLGFRIPGVCFLLVLEGIDGEEQLSNG